MSKKHSKPTFSIFVLLGEKMGEMIGEEVDMLFIVMKHENGVKPCIDRTCATAAATKSSTRSLTL